MLISGGRTHEGAAPFRVITGRGAYVMPFFRHVSFLELSLREAEVEEECVTVQGIVLKVVAVIAFKVGTDEESIVNAAQRFLSDQNQMEVLTGRIFAGHLRSIVGSLTVESIVTERQKLAEEVLGASTSEMAKLGLVVDALQIQSIENGADGLAELVAGLLAQGKRIYETARTPAGGNGVASDGMARAGSSSPDAGGAGNR